jgi:O-antigen/teichoic acid export membrane protein
MTENIHVPAQPAVSVASRTSRNVVANYVGQVWVGAMGFAFIPMYIRYLGVEAYGLIGLFAVLQACLSLLDMGMTPALGREMARFTAGAHSPQSIRNLLHSLEIICFSLATLIALGIWTASGYLASSWLQSDQLSPNVVAQAVGIMALVIALRFCEGIYRGSLLGLQRQIYYNGVHAALTTLRHTGAAVILAWVSPTIQAFFVWQAAISFLAVAVFARAVHGALPRSAVRPRFSPTALAGVWKFATGVMGISVLTLLLTQLDKVLLSRLLSLEDFGYYALATAVAGALYMIIGPITQAVYPRLVELAAAENEGQLIPVYHQAAQFVAVVTAPAVSLVVLFAGGVVFAWSGDVVLAQNAEPMLVALMLGTFLNGLMWVPYQCQLAHGWTSLTLKINTAAVITLVPAILLVVPRYGAVGAAWIWVALNAGYVLIAIHLMHDRLLRHEKVRWYLADTGLPVAGATTVALLARAFQPAEYESRLAWVAFLTLSGGLALAASTMSASRVRARLLAITRALQWRYS